MWGLESLAVGSEPLAQGSKPLNRVQRSILEIQQFGGNFHGHTSPVWGD